jgi:hypothetical protein
MIVMEGVGLWHLSAVPGMYAVDGMELDLFIYLCTVQYLSIA